jgi:hypothetical protein
MVQTCSTHRQYFRLIHKSSSDLAGLAFRPAPRGAVASPLPIPSDQERSAMRRIDPFTFALIMRSLESNRLADVRWGTYESCVRQSRRQPPEPEPVDVEMEDEPINSWEADWIDLGGEG